jgi:hypothetical protein
MEYLHAPTVPAPDDPISTHSAGKLGDLPVLITQCDRYSIFGGAHNAADLDGS